MGVVYIYVLCAEYFKVNSIDPLCILVEFIFFF